MSTTLALARPEPGVYKIQNLLGNVYITFLNSAQGTLTTW